MPKLRPFAAAAFLLLAAVRPAWGETFAADQLRRAEVFLQAGNAVSAVAPLLNVLRRPQEAEADEVRQAKLKLAEAYLKLRLYGGARELIADLEGEGEPWRAKALALRVELHLRKGELQAAFRTLQTYGSSITGPIDDTLLFEVAKAAFANRATFETQLNLDRLADGGKRPEALFYAGVQSLMAHEIDQAYARFDTLSKTIDRRKDPQLFDRVHLALGRLFFENGEPATAARFYAAIPEGSDVYDSALYETAWVYLGEGDETAAAGNLLRLAIEHPFSPLVPKSQVLYGYLLLRKGDFAAAERSFAGYIAHYSALSEVIAELNSTPQDAALYQQIFGRVDEAIASGDDFRIELLTWLQKNERLARSRKLSQSLQTAEQELADVARTLREVQSLAEGGPLSVPLAAQTQNEEDERQLRDLRNRLHAEAARLGGRLSGDARRNFDQVQKQLTEIAALRSELNRVRQRTIDKRRELVSMLQYADAGQWSVWSEEGALEANPATNPTSLSDAQADAMFARLDESERKTLSALRIVGRLETKIIQARSQVLQGRVSGRKLSPLLAMESQLERMEQERLRKEERETGDRIAAATRARVQVKWYISQIAQLRANLIELSRTSVELRGAVSRTEMRKIEREIGSLLVHARLGNADVAWEARKRARERAKEVVLQEQRDMETLRSFYQSLGTPEPEKPQRYAAPATSSMAQQAARLSKEAAGLTDRLDFAAHVFAKQRAASAQLVEKLRAEGRQAGMLARADAAGVLVAAPDPVPGLHLVGVHLLLDGRRADSRSYGVLLDSYLQPGSHQVDVALTYMDDSGELIRFAGSLHFRLEKARGYRLQLMPDRTTAFPHLRFALSNEVDR